MLGLDKKHLALVVAAALLAVMACRPSPPAAAPVPANPAPAPTISPTAADENAYVAWRPAAVRARPAAGAAVIAILEPGSRAKGLDPAAATADGFEWIGVTIEGKEGWVAARDVVRADCYPGLANIDRYSRVEPDIGKLEQALSLANGTGDYPRKRWVAPDGRKYICQLVAPDLTPGPVMLVVYERGIVDVIPGEPWRGAQWQPNSRCLVDAYGPGPLQTLRLYNTETNQIVVFGKAFAQQFECSGAYILYLTLEKPAAPPAGFPANMLVPVLMAYEPAEKTYFRVLEPDLNARRQGKFGAEVKLVPAAGADKLAATILDSLLYYTYVNAYAPCWPEDAPAGTAPQP